jgi:D-ribose pyranase
LKKEGLLNKDLLDLLCVIGHGDYIMVTDRGFPLPSCPYTRVIDLGIVPGYPDFNTIIKAILPEIAVDWLYFTKETMESNPTMISFVKGLLPPYTGISFMDHMDMKEAVLRPETYHERTRHLSNAASRSQNQLLNQSRIVGFIRTGEFTKYTNLLIECGVAF